MEGRLVEGASLAQDMDPSADPEIAGRITPAGAAGRTGSARGEAADVPPDDPAAYEAPLVLRSQRGDRQAFEELVRRTARLLFSRLYVETSDRHRAEDLVQETYLIAWRSIRQVTDASGFRTWLFAVAHSALVDSIRREGRKKRSAPRSGQAVARTGDEALATVPDPRPAPDASAEQQERRAAVLGMLRSLPPEYREPIALRYLAGADYDTIARQLNVSNGSLRGLLNRGMARLREKMQVRERERRGDAKEMGED